MTDLFCLYNAMISSLRESILVSLLSVALTDSHALLRAGSVFFTVEVLDAADLVCVPAEEVLEADAAVV